MSVVWLSLWRGLQVGHAPRIPFGEILATVAAKHEVTVAALLGPSSRRHIAWARHEAMWMAREHTSLSLPAIGARLGGRHHTTILYGIRQHEARIAMEKAA